MANVILRKKAEKADHSFTRPLTKAEIKEIKHFDWKKAKGQKLTRRQRYEIAKTKKDSIDLRKLENMQAENHGFSCYEVYALYQAVMRSCHDIYRRPAKSEMNLHNTLWDLEKDTVQTADQISNKVYFLGNSWLKKLHFLDLHFLQKKHDYLNSSDWYNDNLFLPDNFTRKEMPVMTACKKLDLTFSIFCKISDKKEYHLKISLIAISGQYYLTHEVLPCEMPVIKEKILPDLPLMQARAENAFSKCHVSRNQIFSHIKSDYDRIEYKADLYRHLTESEKIDYQDRPDFDFALHLQMQAEMQAGQAKKAGQAVKKAFNADLAFKMSKSDTLFLEKFRCYED